MALYRAVSLFSGCGGFCEGIRLGGFSVEAAVEADPFAIQTYAHNFPEVPLFHGDIRDFLNRRSTSWNEESHRFEGIFSGPTDLVFGGPPCQGFSQIGPRAVDDPRNSLYKEFVRVLRKLRPRAFVMENVPNILSIADGRFKAEILGALAAAGYRNSTVALIKASDFGVPQARKRAIFFGIRNGLDLGMEAGEFFAKTLDAEHQSGPTVAEALWDLPAEVSLDDGPLAYPPYPRARFNRLPAAEFRLDREGRWYSKEYKLAAMDSAKLLHNHHTKGIRERRLKLIAELKPGANGKTLLPETWQGLRAEKWRRLDPNKPSHTILAQMHRDMSEWVHPWHERWITVREAARLQSFHDGFVFKTSEWQMLKQVGNAVPPLMARALAAVAQAALDRIGGV